MLSAEMTEPPLTSTTASTFVTTTPSGVPTALPNVLAVAVALIAPDAVILAELMAI